jgi:hypothetical protein
MGVETAFGLAIIIAWFAVVAWGAVDLVVEAKRVKDWEKVAVALLGATTVAGPLLTLMPDHVFLGIHTIGLGFVLAFISAGAILFSRRQLQRLLNKN